MIVIECLAELSGLERVSDCMLSPGENLHRRGASKGGNAGAAPGAECIEGVVACSHALVVMHALDTPELLLAVVDDVADDGALLAAAAVATGVAQRHDAARVRRWRRFIPAGGSGRCGHGL